MAKNFEIIFNLDAPMVDRNGRKKQWHENEILSEVEKHNCKWILSPHVPDKESSFNHFHLGIHTDSDNTYETIAKWFDLPTNSVNKIYKRFETTYALYLAHYNNKDGKTPVPFEKIKTSFNLDYDDLVARIEKKRVDDNILNDLADGKINEYDLYSTQSSEWCRKHIKDINNSLIVRSKKFMVSDKVRNMDVVYIYGNARTGKSYLAKKMCKDANMSFYVSSSGKNPFDDYMGQDAIILDDVRPSDFKFSELLKILDNHMSSKVSARYHNVDLNCKVLYITTVLSLDDFYKAIQESYNEAVEQLRGRINTVVKVSPKTMTISVLEDDNKTYRVLFDEVPNPLLSDEEIKEMSIEKKIEAAKKLFSGIGDLSEYAVKKLDGFARDNDIDF